MPRTPANTSKRKIILAFCICAFVACDGGIVGSRQAGSRKRASREAAIAEVERDTVEKKSVDDPELRAKLGEKGWYSERFYDNAATVGRGEKPKGSESPLEYAITTKSGKPRSNLVVSGDELLVTKYTASGKRSEEVRYTNGLQTGLWQQWWPNGRLKAEGTYQKGKKEGLFSYYRVDGSLREQGDFNQDQKSNWKLHPRKAR